jgi:hypothetical protein
METNGQQDIGATAFDMPNSKKPENYGRVYYGNQHVPTPCNHEAERTPKEKVMGQVLRAR